MEKNTRTSEWSIRTSHDIQWHEVPKRRRGEELMKNLGVAAALVLCAVALKSGAIPSARDATDAVLASVSDDTLLDDHLGKLSFVSRMFPEATLVFGESSLKPLTVPVSGGMVVHAWSEEEPYTAWRTGHREVYAAGSGVVMGVYHGENEERLVQVRGEDGLSCLYGNLLHAEVQTGDQVEAGKLLGILMEGEDCVFEVRCDGISVDPADYLRNVT